VVEVNVDLPYRFRHEQYSPKEYVSFERLLASYVGNNMGIDRFNAVIVLTHLLYEPFDHKRTVEIKTS
jgi:hypothetical protein